MVGAVLFTSLTLCMVYEVLRAATGLVTLAWDVGVPPETTVVNLTTGEARNAGTRGRLTWSGLSLGSNYTFVATNTAGASKTLTALISVENKSLLIEVFTLKLTWPGSAGTLQASSNLVDWVDERAIDANSFFFVTNNAVKQFYRVKI